MCAALAHNYLPSCSLQTAAMIIDCNQVKFLMSFISVALGLLFCKSCHLTFYVLLSQLCAVAVSHAFSTASHTTHHQLWLGLVLVIIHIQSSGFVSLKAPPLTNCCFCSSLLNVFVGCITCIIHINADLSTAALTTNQWLWPGLIWVIIHICSSGFVGVEALPLTHCCPSLFVL